MHFGNSQWKQRPREEQAEADGTEECEKVAHLLGVEAADLIKGLLKPRIKVSSISDVQDFSFDQSIEFMFD